MENRLLTADEIDSVLKESTNPKYQIDNLLHIGIKATSIQRISKKSGLILISGNEFTGLDHIVLRHHPMLKAGHWIKGDKIKLEEPSQFRLGTIPLFDFLTIADEVFKPENRIDDQRNKEPELFELYIGKYTDKMNVTMDYKLLLYKSTPIIHNLIPNKKTFNKKKIVDLRQGFTSSSLDDKRGIHTYRIPYFDHLDVERAKAIITIQTSTGQEDWSVQVNDKSGQAMFIRLVESRTVSTYIEMPFRLSELDYHEDFSKIEKVIREIIKGLE